jgi:vitamin B12 transporter
MAFSGDIFAFVLACAIGSARIARAQAQPQEAQPQEAQPQEAQPPPVGAKAETIVIVGSAPAEAARDRDRALGEAPFITVIHPDEHPATASVADAVGQTAGALTRSLGGLGAYESVSIRGEAPGQTLVLIDGVPLARIAAVTVDLGRFTLDSFGQVELYRGAVPVELGGAGVGGALNMTTRLGPGDHGQTIDASIGAGSFGARHLRFHHGDSYRGDSLRSSTTIGYQAATGNFTYFDNDGTPLNLADDHYATRENNGFSQVDGASRLGTSDGSDAVGLRALWKEQGLPGSTQEPALHASLDTLDVIGDAHAEHALGDSRERELAFLLVETQALHDPDGELGLGVQDREYLTLSGGVDSTWHAMIAGARASAGIELRGDHFRDEDERGIQPTVDGNREAGAALASLDVPLAPNLVVTPAMRYDLVRTAPAPETSGPTALAPVPTRWDEVPSPRVTVRLTASSDLAIKGSIGWYVRLPTLIELFGDRGYIVGSPTLLPEHGPSGDFGCVWAPARAIASGVVDRVLVEADVFGARPRDTIAFITTGGYITRAENIAQSESYGGELVASARAWRTLSLTASFTQLTTAQLSDDVNFNGKSLPREPPQTLYTRADVVRTIAHHAAAAWLDASYQAESYLANAELGEVPARLLFGTGARVELAAHVSLAVVIENLTDNRVVYLPLSPPPSPTFTSTPVALSDVAGFPLPGRSLYVSLSWSH